MKNKKNFHDVTLSCDEKEIIDANNDLNFKWKKSGIFPLQKLFHYDQCPKIFIFENNSKEHMLSHAGTNSRSCNICDKLFLCESKIKVHVETQSNKCYVKYFYQTDLKGSKMRGRSFLAKMVEIFFIFQVF